MSRRSPGFSPSSRSFCRGRAKSNPLHPSPAAALLHSNRQVIFERTMALRIPAIYQFPESAEQGGFASYGPRIEQTIYPPLAIMIARLFRGELPQDIPGQQPTTFELVINLKIAQTVSLMNSEGLLMRA